MIVGETSPTEGSMSAIKQATATIATPTGDATDEEEEEEEEEEFGSDDASLLDGEEDEEE